METLSQGIICFYVYIICFLIGKNIFYRFLELLSNLVQNALKLDLSLPFTLCKAECPSFLLNAYHHSMIVAHFANSVINTRHSKTPVPGLKDIRNIDGTLIHPNGGYD